MKIYTYYQDISHSSQNELIDLWKISWSRQGYEPIVLNLEDANFKHLQPYQNAKQKKNNSYIYKKDDVSFASHSKKYIKIIK